MSAPGCPAVEEILAGAVSSGTLPGAVFATGTGGDIEGVVVVGDAQRLGGPVRPMKRETLFDLASLTKIVATTSSALLLVGAGRLHLEDSARAYVPEFAGDGRDHVTVRHLLSHTSGLPAEVMFWRNYARPDLARQALRSTPLEAAPGARVEYSDVGYMLLGEVVEAASGMALDEAVAALVTRPLGMTSTLFNPGEQDRGRAAGTEPASDGTATAGTVHDENARFFGGVMGHAGLFSTVDDLVSYLGAWLDGPSLPSMLSAWQAEACRNQTAGLNGSRGLGWVGRGDPADFLDDSWPLTSVSHTGFTGTSIAMDTVSRRWAVMLTNDVHFGRQRGTIPGLRRRAHAACGPLAAGGR